MKKITLALTLSLSIVGSLGAHAQDYDDDLYYSPSKAAKEQQKKAELYRQASAASTSNASAAVSTASVPLQMDVDTYNRRNEAPATSGSDAMATDFNYTRRIERYHNPDVVLNSGDTALIDYYYSTPSQQDINVYVINNVEPLPYAWNYNAWNALNYPYAYYSWSWPIYRPYWSLSWGFDPWFDLSWGWGPSWGYGPSWGWGWSWSPGWHNHWYPSYPGHGPGHGPGGHPGHNPGVAPSRPGNSGWANSAGGSRPHRPVYSGGSSSSNRTPSTGRWDYDRPGNMGRPTGTGSANGNYRPSTTGSNSGSYTAPNDRRGSSSKYGSNNSGNRNNNSNNSNSSRSYNNSSNSSRNSGSSYSSGSSYRGGSGSSHSSGSSYRGGGGNSSGGGRGRR